MKKLIVFTCLYLVATLTSHAQYNLIMNQEVAKDLNHVELVKGAKDHIVTGLPLCIDSQSCTSFLLDNSESVKELIHADSQVRIFETVDHYLLADDRGDCAVIEFLDGRMIVHTDQELPFAILTNSTYSKSINFLDRDVAELKERDALQHITSSLRRFKIATDRVKAFKPTSTNQAVRYAFDTLDQVGGDATL